MTPHRAAIGATKSAASGRIATQNRAIPPGASARTSSRSVFLAREWAAAALVEAMSMLASARPTVSSAGLAAGG